jgi:hypothetical protein
MSVLFKPFFEFRERVEVSKESILPSLQQIKSQKHKNILTHGIDD